MLIEITIGVAITINNIVSCLLVTRQYVMGSEFDNSIYWIISHAIITIRYYTFTTAVSMTRELL
jgi:hypothetical protein